MLDTPCSEVVWRVLSTHSIRQFPLHFPSRASPCAFTFQLASNAGYTMFWGSVKSTDYPLHSPVSTSLPLPCVTVCHHISTGLYLHRHLNKFQENNIWTFWLTLCTKPSQIGYVYSIGHFYTRLLNYILGDVPLRIVTPSTRCSVEIITGGARNVFVTGAPFIASPSTEVLSQIFMFVPCINDN